MESTLADLLQDPDLVLPFVILRRAEGMVKGRSVITETPEDATGVVQPAMARELERLPEADRVKSTIAVFTVAPLRVGDEAQGISADGIVWRGDTYTIAAVEDWTQYGFYKALAHKEAT